MPCRCIGWYHSHPSFAAMPSVIDIANQARQQIAHRCALDERMSVFSGKCSPTPRVASELPEEACPSCVGDVGRTHGACSLRRTGTTMLAARSRM